MDYLKLAQKYAGNHNIEGCKEDAFWVIALSLLSIAESNAAQQPLALDGATCAAPDCEKPAVYNIGLCANHVHTPRK